MNKNCSIDETTIISLQESPEETAYDFIPSTFDEYLGQEELKVKLHIYLKAALLRNEALDHLLIFGPPGLGKTTLAHIMASMMKVNIKICSGPMLERTGDLVAILSSLEPKSILFIDEIHRLPTTIEEVLYSAMEQFKVDVIIGQGVGAKSISLPINPFTLIGATTKSGMISAPLRSRFGITERINYYNNQTLAHIIIQNSTHLNITIDYEAAYLLAKCSRGTPRIAKKLVRRVRDIAQVQNKTHIQENLVTQALALLGIDKDGLTNLDLLLLKKIAIDFNGGPVGLETLAYIIGEDKETLEAVYEPFLMRKGLLEKTARGRKIPAVQLPILLKKFDAP